MAPPTPTIVAAAIDDVTKITLTLNVQYQLSGTGDEGFVVSDGTTNYAVSSVTGLNGTGLTNPTGKSSKLSLNLAKAIVLGKKYTVSKDTYGSANAIEGNIYDSQSFADAYTYTGNDLGVTYSKTESKFRVWAPTASAVNIVKYPNSNATLQQATLIAMTADVKELTTVKSPTEFFEKQNAMMRKQFDAAMAATSKNSEAMLKLASEAFQPISNRVSLAVEKIKHAA